MGTIRMMLVRLNQAMTTMMFDDYDDDDDADDDARDYGQLRR